MSSRFRRFLLDSRFQYFLSLFIGANSILLAWSFWSRQNGWWMAYCILVAAGGVDLILYALWRGWRLGNKKPPSA